MEHSIDYNVQYSNAQSYVVIFRNELCKFRLGETYRNRSDT